MGIDFFYTALKNLYWDSERVTIHGKTITISHPSAPVENRNPFYTADVKVGESDSIHLTADDSLFECHLILSVKASRYTGYPDVIVIRYKDFDNQFQIVELIINTVNKSFGVELLF